MFVEKLPAHPEYAKAAPVDKAANKKVNPTEKEQLEEDLHMTTPLQELSILMMLSQNVLNQKDNVRKGEKRQGRKNKILTKGKSQDV